MSLTVADFDYDLPAHLIAQQPLPNRTASRLMVVDQSQDMIHHHSFTDILSFIHSNDILVLNNTKVIPARLFGQKATGGKIECLVERVVNDHEVLVHLKSSKSPKPGAQLIFEDVIRMEMLGREGELFRLKLLNDESVFRLLDQHGHMPLPPYIERADTLNDRDRYQTVFGHREGAVAAPTASLHFDETLLARIRDQGTAIVEVTLHVGAGTFQPVRVDEITDHQMHQEWIDVPLEAVERIQAAKANGGRVIAIGTTVMRALESAALNGTLAPYCGETDIFIYPGFKFKAVDVLLTNFHLPKSTLLMLVAALGGYNLIMQAYQAAVAAEYRFFSYGDAMLIL